MKNKEQREQVGLDRDQLNQLVLLFIASASASASAPLLSSCSLEVDVPTAPPTKKDEGPEKGQEAGDDKSVDKSDLEATSTKPPTEPTEEPQEPTNTLEPTLEPTPTSELPPTLAPGEYPPLPEDESQWEQDTIYTMIKEDGAEVEVFLSRGQGELVEVQTSAFIEKIFAAEGGPVGVMSLEKFRSYTEGLDVVSYEYNTKTPIDVNTAVVFGVVEGTGEWLNMEWLRVLVPDSHGKYHPVLLVSGDHGYFVFKLNESGVVERVSGRGGTLAKFSEIGEAGQIEIKLGEIRTHTDDESATIELGQVIPFLVEIEGGDNSPTFIQVSEINGFISSSADIDAALLDKEAPPYVGWDEDLGLVLVALILDANQFK